jgi:hypothetical protein
MPEAGQETKQVAGAQPKEGMDAASPSEGLTAFDEECREGERG